MGSKIPVTLLAEEKAEGYHLLIDVFGKEYSYGPEGITIQYERIEKGRKKPEKVPMGYTVETKSDFYDFVDKINKDWTAVKHNSRNHNSHHFAQEIMKYLGITTNIPKKYTVVTDIVAPLLTEVSARAIILGSGMSGVPTTASAISGSLVTPGSGISGISSLTLGSIIQGAFVRVGFYLFSEFKKNTIAAVKSKK